MSLLKHMCPKCENYMPLDLAGALSRYCKTCNYRQEEEKGLVMETVIQQKASEAYKMFLNEFTLEDPRIPASDKIKCPNGECPTRTGRETPNVKYIKDDPVNLKFTYICAVCKSQWRSRG